VAIEPETGETLWTYREPHTIVVNGVVVVGNVHEQVRGAQEVDVSYMGGTGHSIQLVMGELLVQTTEDLRGEAEVNEKGMPLLHVRDKRRGRILAGVALPIPGQYGTMTYMHEGKTVHRGAGGQRATKAAGFVVADAR
jgi:hypothetical protein